ncbi:MAG TPA: alpha/beta hydrolase [Burkholderiaceae bacterium]|nr:alpha/beta hydrolase [Burkholderiaceae bacterium]
MAPSSRPAAPAPSLVESDTTLALADGASVQVRMYGQRRRGVTLPLVVHFHGGAFVSGSLDDGATMARLLAAADAVVVSVGYPLAPAHPFPQAVETGYAALQWAYKNRSKLAGPGASVYVAGEEAGGNLAAAITLVARDRAHPPLAGQILVAPMLDPTVGTASLRECLGCEIYCKWAQGWQQYLRSPMDAEHPYAVPGRTQRLGGLPPTLVLTGKDDPMHDEALVYVKRLQGAGIAVRSAVLPVTGWPDSLCQAPDCEGACSESVQAHFRSFFNAATPAPPALPS